MAELTDKGAALLRQLEQAEQSGAELTSKGRETLQRLRQVTADVSPELQFGTTGQARAANLPVGTRIKIAGAMAEVKDRTRPGINGIQFLQDAPESVTTPDPSGPRVVVPPSPSWASQAGQAVVDTGKTLLGYAKKLAPAVINTAFQGSLRPAGEDVKAVMDVARAQNQSTARARQIVLGKMGLTEDQILAQAQRTGEVPTGRIAANQALEAGAFPIVLPTSGEAAMLAAGGPIAEAAGVLAEPVARFGQRVAAPVARALAEKFPQAAEAVTTAAKAVGGFLTKERSLLPGKTAAAAAEAAPSILDSTIKPQEAGEIADLLASQTADNAAREIPLAPIEQETIDMAAAQGLPKTAPIFESESLKRALIRAETGAKELGGIKSRMGRLSSKIDWLQSVRSGSVGPLPTEPAAMAKELSLLEQDASNEIETYARSLHKQAREAKGGPTTLEEFVQESGGIRPFRPDPATGKPVQFEEWKDLPEIYKASPKSTKGAPADILAQNAYDAGLLQAPDPAELMRTLRSSPQQSAGRAAWEAYVPDAEHQLLDPAAGNNVARRYLELRDRLGSEDLFNASKVKVVRGKMSQADLESEYKKLGLEWEQKKAAQERLGQVDTGRGAPPPPSDIVDATGGPDQPAPNFAGNVRLSKFPRQDVREHMRAAAEKLGLNAEEAYGGVKTMGESLAQARKLAAAGVDIDSFLKLERGTALSDSEMALFRLKIDDLGRQLTSAENLWQSRIGTPEEAGLFAESSRLQAKFEQAFDRLSEFVSTSGRALNIQKAVNPELLDLPTEYRKRLMGSAPVQEMMSAERAAFLREKMNEFQRLPQAAQAELFMKEMGLGAWEQFRTRWMGTVRPFMNMWRASLISQLGTAARNFSSQGIAGLWNLADDLVAGGIEGVIGLAKGEKPTDVLRRASAASMEDLISFTRRFSSEDRQFLRALLSTSNFKEIGKQLGETPIAELDKIPEQLQNGYIRFSKKYADVLSFATRLAEKEERKYFFEAALRGRLRKTYPELLNTLDFKNLPTAQFKDVMTMAADSLDDALRMTFAQDFKGGLAGTILKLSHEPVIGDLMALDLTFPRFLANSYDWLWRHSPGTFLELAVSPAQRRAFLSGNAAAVKRVAGGISGSLLGFGTALKLRSDPKYSDGTRWWEINLPASVPKYGGQKLNTLYYAPVVAPFMFAAELAAHGTSRMMQGDVAQGILQTRIAGTSRLLLDFASGRLDEKTGKKMAARFAGDFFGGFATPLSNVRDLLAGFDNFSNEAVRRDTKRHPVAGPFLARLPLANGVLPPAVSPTRSGALRNETPWLRQLTGLTARDPNALEEFLTKINFDVGQLYPKSGNPKRDWLVTKELGAVAEQKYPSLLRRLEEDQAKLREDGREEDDIKESMRIGVTQAYSYWRRQAEARARRQDPALFKELKQERARGPMRRALIRRGQLVGGDYVGRGGLEPSQESESFFLGSGQ